MEKVLTISIAAYNVEKYIRKALDSLVDESIIDDLEIFVVDDGGTDKTLDIAEEYAKRYPQSVFLVHKDNGGYGSTINTSIELATGKYFKQLDGDDWYDTENLKDLVKILKMVSVDCVLTQVTKYNDITKETLFDNNYSYVNEGVITLEQSGIKDQFLMHASAFSTKILKKMPSRLTEHCFYTDTEYCIFPVPYINTVYVFHKTIYIYRTGVEGQSMNADSIAKHYKEQEYVFWRLFDVYNMVSENKRINKELIGYTLEKKMEQYYRFLCILPITGFVKKEIARFTQEAMGKCPEIVEQAKKSSKFVKILIDSHFATYPFLAWWMKRKWRKDGRLV